MNKKLLPGNGHSAPTMVSGASGPISEKKLPKYCWRCEHWRPNPIKVASRRPKTVEAMSVAGKCTVGGRGNLMGNLPPEDPDEVYIRIVPISSGSAELETHRNHSCSLWQKKKGY